MEQKWGAQPSGWGSTLDSTKVTRRIVSQVISEYGIGSMVDVPCGDFEWMSHVVSGLPKSFEYLGADIVEVNFQPCWLAVAKCFTGGDPQ